MNPLRLQYSWQEKVVQERFLLGANLWLRLHISKHVFQCCFISDLYHKMEICYLNKIIIIRKLLKQIGYILNNKNISLDQIIVQAQAINNL